MYHMYVLYVSYISYLCIICIISMYQCILSMYQCIISMYHRIISMYHCIVSMCHIYVSCLCIIPMYRIYSFYIFVSASNLLSLPGGKSPMKTNLQNQNFNFLKIALNRLEPLPKDASRRELFESVSRSKKGSFCVGIGQFYCNKRILVPMSYIAFVQNIKLQT